MSSLPRVLASFLLVALLGACGDSRTPPDPRADSGTAPGPTDSGSDAGPDAGAGDAGRPDAGAGDAGSSDAGATDAGSDAGGTDAGSDAGSSDAGATDAGSDAGAPDAGTETGVDAGIVYVDPGPGHCRGSWCWEYPRPQGNRLNAVWTSATETWAVGAGGTAIRWDGTQWHATETGTTTTLMGVWGSSPQDVWAVGLRRTLLHWDGTRWSPVSLAAVAELDLMSVTGSGPNDVHIAGYGYWNTRTRGAAFHWDGTAWTNTILTSYMNFSDLHSRGPDDVWLSGRESVYQYNDAGTWYLHSTAPEWLNALWGAGPSPQWAAGNETLYQWQQDGGTWEPRYVLPDVTNYASTFLDLWGSGPDDVWAAASAAPGLSGLHHWDGRSWKPHPAGQNAVLAAVTGTSASDVWTVGSSGVALRYDGTDWSQLSDPKLGPMFASAGAPDDFWMAGASGTLLHWDGERWTRHSSGTSMDLAGLWAGASQDVWAVGSSGTLLHWNGTRWSAVPSGVTVTLRGVWGSRTDDVWAVGDDGTVLHWDGGQWSKVQTSLTQDLMDVWGSSATDVWAVGHGGTVAHFDGSQWTRITLGFSLDFGTELQAVQGSSASDVWVVAHEGKVLHFNGSTWRLQADFDGTDSRSIGDRSDTLTDNVDVVVAGPGDVWVISWSQMRRNVSHWNGTSWTWEPGLSTGGLLTGAMRGTELVVGDAAGSILRRR